MIDFDFLDLRSVPPNLAVINAQLLQHLGSCAYTERKTGGLLIPLVVFLFKLRIDTKAHICTGFFSGAVFLRRVTIQHSLSVVNSIVQCVKEVVQHRHLLRRLLTGSCSGIQCTLSLNHAAHSVQQLCKEVLDLFDNGLLFFLGQVCIFRQPLGELLAALLRAGFTTDEVKDHLADGIFNRILLAVLAVPIYILLQQVNLVIVRIIAGCQHILHDGPAGVQHFRRVVGVGVLAQLVHKRGVDMPTVRVQHHLAIGRINIAVIVAFQAAVQHNVQLGLCRHTIQDFLFLRGNRSFSGQRYNAALVLICLGNGGLGGADLLRLLLTAQEQLIGSTTVHNPHFNRCRQCIGCLVKCNLA